MEKSTNNIVALPNEVEKIIQGKAFIYPYAIDSQEVLGNPASIVFCNKSFPTKDIMAQIAIQEKAPMTAYVLQLHENVFAIDFYTPSGNEFSLCGHATIIASHFILEQYGFEKVIFTKDGFHQQLITTNIHANGNKEFTLITMPAFMPVEQSLLDATAFINCFSIEQSQVVSVYKCNELNDVILIVQNAEILRNIEPNFSELAYQLSQNNIRGLFITALSNLPEIDYEVRIFAPHFDIDEDISCGSANCSLLPLWSKLLDAVSDKEFKILCPYNFTTNKMGGVEIGQYNSNNHSISIGGIIGA